ncbi:hypothetical protein ACEWY4_021169 [Coilia grayii]|uniref:G-protein coupled receptors family 1 profile domain-containing protein n=1 Tax=Coilia grayii TaxID=363190 RepID=A0ABD1J896_9TELE
MKMPYNQTYTVIPDFEHNETNCLQNYNCTTSGWDVPFPLNDVTFIVYWVIFFIALPGICFALYKLRSQMTPDQVAPVYVINLLISDLIQICSNPIRMTAWQYGFFVSYVPYLYLHVNVFFMMCKSVERYIMIAHAVWYRKIQSRRTSVIVSVIIWMVSAVVWITSFFLPNMYGMVSVLLLPYPLVIFFFVATWRALSRTSVPRNDQKRIMATLALVLCIYTILFLPFILLLFDVDNNLFISAEILIALNPLFDLLLYVLIRRDVKDDLRALLSCFNKRPKANRANV